MSGSPSTYVVTGTGTAIGKTIFAAALAGALGATYWKPVQAGLPTSENESETDSQTVARLAGTAVLPEAYRLKMPASPHRAAAAEGIIIDPARLDLPKIATLLVVEGAGGLMVPLTPDLLFLDMFARWQAPLILCAATHLGTINHSLLSLESIRTRNIPLLGVAFIGAANDDSERIICRLGRAKRLGRLDPIADLNAASLAAAFTAGFDLGDFR